MTPFTVGICARNAERTLGAVLEAVHRQDPLPTHLIVVDDGSTDHTLVIAGRAAGVEVVHFERNRGLAAARNAVLRQTSTPFLIFLDADAVPHEGCFQALLGPLADDNVAAVGGRGMENRWDNAAQQWRALYTAQDHGMERLDDDWMIMGLCCAFRVEDLRDAGGFDESFREAGEDADISIRLREAGRKLVYNPAAVVHHEAGGDFSDIQRQAFRHSRQATRALLKNGLSPLDYWIHSTGHVVRSTLRELADGHLAMAGVGLANFTARTAGFAAGTVLNR